jgi:outer membrane protein OmpA-like peptidoglycan-associated protein
MAAKQDSLDAALKAAKDAEARLRALEQEMRDRLAKIQAIADQSEGRITVEPQADDNRIIKVTMHNPVNFDFDKANIRPEEYPTLKSIGEILNTYPGDKVQLSGHTDWVGTNQYNIHLSHRRIDSVMAYLISKENVDASRFFMPVGYGESRPVATNETEEGRFKNRRVEFLIFTYDAQPEIPDGTAIKGIERVDANTIQIVGNGKIPLPTSTMSLSNPTRFVMDFQDIYLISKQKEFTLNAGPVIQARAAEHIEDDFTRVVLDLTQPINPQMTINENKIIIKLR